jgi:serine protease Do
MDKEEFRVVAVKKRNKFIKIILSGCVAFLCFVLFGGTLAGVFWAEKKGILSKEFLKVKNVIQSEEGKSGSPGSNNDNKIINYRYDNVEIEDTITDVVEKVSKSVVSVAEVSSVEENIENIENPSTIGTAFIIDSRNGYLLTNKHVVSDDKANYVIVTIDDKKYNVEKIFRDGVNDIAVLKVDFKGDVYDDLELGDSDLLKVGQTVIAIGNPLGEYPGTVTRGIVSGLHRTVEAADDMGNVTTYEDVIQTDAAINFGNSGGPLLNIKGQVVGINFGINRSYEAEGISFAMPINKVKKRLNDLDTYGYFPTPYLGVSYRMIDDVEALMYHVPKGALITGVVAGSPAEKSGIKRGDIIVEVNGEELKIPLASVIQKYNIGDELKLKVWRSENREEQYFELIVKLVNKEALEKK